MGWRNLLNSVNFTEDRTEKFSAALKAAMIREKGMHGSVGTQNEKLIHATLKNYYAPYCDEQEIKIGNYFADAVSEDGIFEIQTRGLYRLKEKLRAFLEHSRVTVVYPIISEYKNVFINSDTGETVKESSARKIKSELKIFEELYSIREFLTNKNLTVILCFLKAEKRIYFKGDSKNLPDMRNKYERKKCVIQKIPIEILKEEKLEDSRDYSRFIPGGISGEFTKKQLSAAAKESCSSLRTEVLRTVGLIEKTGKIKNEIVYRNADQNCCYEGKIL